MDRPSWEQVYSRLADAPKEDMNKRGREIGMRLPDQEAIKKLINGLGDAKSKRMKNEGKVPNVPTKRVKLEVALGKVPFVFIGTLIERAKTVALELEKLTLKPHIDSLALGLRNGETPKFFDKDGKNNTKHVEAPGEITIVNEEGKVILWAVIKWEEDDVCNYATPISGLTPERLKNGVDFRMVERYVIEILKGKTVVGHDMGNNLKFWNFGPNPFDGLVDTQDIYGKKELEYLAIKYSINVKDEGRTHSSITDARRTMRLYLHHLGSKKLHKSEEEIPGPMDASGRFLVKYEDTPLDWGDQ